jgi:FMN phosphatase YigB (HAD superfamily)
MKIIFDYNRTIFDPETDNIYPGVIELLKKLSVYHKLFLVSRNEPERKKRFEDLHIKDYFQKIAFVNQKSTEVFKEISGDTKNVIVVGDSIADEIKIGNQLGYITVRLKKGMFAEKSPTNKDEIATYNIHDMSELENIIRDYEK